MDLEMLKMIPVTEIVKELFKQLIKIGLFLFIIQLIWIDFYMPKHGFEATLIISLFFIYYLINAKLDLMKDKLSGTPKMDMKKAMALANSLAKSLKGGSNQDS